MRDPDHRAPHASCGAGAASAAAASLAENYLGLEQKV
jgi:hypothetical protein